MVRQFRSTLFIICILFTACSGSKELNCSKFYTYSSRKVDIKSIASSLKKQGIEIASVSIGEITIEPKYLIASERLQQLDLLQYTLCNQIRSFPKKDTAKRVVQLSYISTLQKMIFISQNPLAVDSITKN